MTVKLLLRVTALAEGGMALAFLLAPSLPSQLVFGEPLRANLSLLLGRLLGAAVLSLALLCWWASSDPSRPLTAIVLKTMLLYDTLAGGLLIYARISLGLSGGLLWAGVAVHAALGALCILALKRWLIPAESNVRYDSSRDLDRK